MYGLTSAWQFLHTTKRSGWDMPTILRSARARSGELGGYSGPHSGRGRGDDLGHDLVEVVIGLVDDDLTGGAVAALEQVANAVERVLGAEILRVRRQALEQALRVSAFVATFSLDGRSTISPSRPWRAASHLFSSSICHGYSASAVPAS